MRFNAFKKVLNGVNAGANILNQAVNFYNGDGVQSLLHLGTSLISGIRGRLYSLNPVSQIEIEDLGSVGDNVLAVVKSFAAASTLPLTPEITVGVVDDSDIGDGVGEVIDEVVSPTEDPTIESIDDVTEPVIEAAVETMMHMDNFGPMMSLAAKHGMDNGSIPLDHQGFVQLSSATVEQIKGALSTQFSGATVEWYGVGVGAEAATTLNTPILNLAPYIFTNTMKAMIMLTEGPALLLAMTLTFNADQNVVSVVADGTHSVDAPSGHLRIASLIKQEAPMNCSNVGLMSIVASEQPGVPESTAANAVAMAMTGLPAEFMEDVNTSPGSDRMAHVLDRKKAIVSTLLGDAARAVKAQKSRGLGKRRTPYRAGVRVVSQPSFYLGGTR
jgi:hypothetical protein